jgi:hypothetical protein
MVLNLASAFMAEDAVFHDRRHIGNRRDEMEFRYFVAGHSSLSSKRFFRVGPGQLFDFHKTIPLSRVLFGLKSPFSWCSFAISNI